MLSPHIVSALLAQREDDLRHAAELTRRRSSALVGEARGGAVRERCRPSRRPGYVPEWPIGGP